MNIGTHFKYGYKLEIALSSFECFSEIWDS